MKCIQTFFARFERREDCYTCQDCAKKNMSKCKWCTESEAWKPLSHFGRGTDRTPFSICKLCQQAICSDCGETFVYGEEGPPIPPARNRPHATKCGQCEKCEGCQTYKPIGEFGIGGDRYRYSRCLACQYPKCFFCKAQLKKIWTPSPLEKDPVAVCPSAKCQSQKKKRKQ